MQVDQVWQACLDSLIEDLAPEHFNTWIKPLQVDTSSQAELVLIAPNPFVRNWVSERFLTLIDGVLEEVTGGHWVSARIELNNGQPVQNRTAQVSGFSRPGFQAAAPTPQAASARTASLASKGWQTGGEVPASIPSASAPPPQAANPLAGLATRHTSNQQSQSPKLAGLASGVIAQSKASANIEIDSNSPLAKTLEETAGNVTLNTSFTFDKFVEGKANQLAKAAASQVVENPGQSYNPLFIYGGVGLGKTHLMHAVGNELVKRKPDAKIVYLHSERFVADMVKALQLNAITEFKRYYRSVDALLIDDIQFFANKDRSQEEFFHTFNALLEGGQQVILTCDRYPKEIDGLEERLKSRFGWGLTVAVEPPELEMRVAILNKKAATSNIELPSDAAFFIAQRIRSNVRELEGALKRVIAGANFMGKPIDIDVVKDSLKDLLALQDRQVRLENIQRVVADYYKIKLSDLMSKRRSRSVARPRQVAMALAKELTNHSLPEIGENFGGRDHTTVIHACRKVKELVDSDADINEDYKNLVRILTT